MKRLLMWAVVLCMPITSQAADQCSDILQGGFINTETLNSSVGITNDFNAWLCTTEFHTHQEARYAGIGLGVLVYGVPLGLNGNFNSSTIDTWKRDHCQSTTDRSQYAATYSRVISEISNAVVSAWRDCMLGLYQNRIGLTGVAIAHGPNLVSMKVRWTPYDQFDTRLPRVTGFSIVGATNVTTGSSLFHVGVNVPATETNVEFRRNSPSDAVVLTLNTDRGSVPTYVPPQAMELRIHAEFNPTIEQRDFQNRDYSFYQADPDDDCVKDLNFDQDYYPPAEYSYVSYSFSETTKNGDRTSYSPSEQPPPPAAPTHVHFHMHVQGDDGLGGFCKRHGWLGLSIHVQGDRWTRVAMTPFSVDQNGKPSQESVVVHYPYLQPTGNTRGFQMPFIVTVEKVIGDDVTTVQLTDASPTTSGITARSDSSGNLTVDASEAFAQWRSSLPNPPHPHALVAARQRPVSGDAVSFPLPGATVVDKRALEACKALDSAFVVIAIDTDRPTGSYRVTCGTLPSEVSKGAQSKLSKTSFKLQ